MRPSEWRDVRQELGRTVEAGALSGCDCVAKMLGVPIYDN